MTPAQTDPRLQNYIKELAKKGHQFNGFTEYGRGVTAKGTTPSPALAAARVNVIKLDATYLRSLPNVDVWAYWFTTDIASGEPVEVHRRRLDQRLASLLLTRRSSLTKQAFTSGLFTSNCLHGP